MGHYYKGSNTSNVRHNINESESGHHIVTNT